MRLPYALSLALLVSLAVPTVGASHLDTDEFRKGCPFSEDEWQDGVYDCGGRIPSIQSPSFDDGAWLEDGDVVIGVAHGSEAKAYPIPILNWHEIVNDRIGGEEIVVSYCPLCGSSIVFDREVEGQVLDLHVSGYLFRQDLVMVDEQTHSLWPQIEGQAARGELHGTILEIFPSTTMSWGQWKEEHPDTEVLSRPQCGDGSTGNRASCSGDFQRDYDRSPYGNYDQSGQIGVSGENRDEIKGLHPKDVVLGLSIDGTHKAYPFFALSEVGVVNDEVQGTPVVVGWAGSDGHGYVRPEASVTFEPGETRGTMVDGEGNVYQVATGTSETGPDLEELDGLDLFWFAWIDHHPKTLLYTANGTVEVDHTAPNSTPGPGLGALLVAGLTAVAARAVASGRDRL